MAPPHAPPTSCKINSITTPLEHDGETPLASSGRSASILATPGLDFMTTEFHSVDAESSTPLVPQEHLKKKETSFNGRGEILPMPF